MGGISEGLRLPPHSIEAEQSVLGSLLIDNAAWEKVDGVIKSGDFYRDEHRRIFRHIEDLINAGKPADAVTVAEKIDREGDNDKTGGLAYLGELAQNTPSAANARRYAEIVRERAICRRLITVGDSISARAFNPKGIELAEMLDKAEQELYAVCETRANASSGPVGINAILSSVVEHVEKMADKDDPHALTGVGTGYHDLDKMTSGLQPGDLVVVAGRPSMGKTAFALNIAEHVAVVEDLPVLIFSMEMGKEQVGMRMVSSVGRIDHQKLRSGKLQEDDWSRMTYALGKISQANIEIDDTGGLTAGEIRSRARRFARAQRKQVGLIVIDYLQLMAAMKEGENRATEISAMSRALKALGKELGAPIVALSQLSRKVEERADKRPMLSDLRESGAIEQDADVVVMMYREEYYKPETEYKGMAEAIIAKQRNGPVGTVKLTFLGEYVRFENYSHRSW